ncbi:ABC transporter ATP-binding protein SaoA [Maridesulfovibrio frigidus]|uniref:ABC transporter ATP-binding protein SaoA n=1 Tax=Maridesulfovibrio frigidus TaxID=340956 RepID=UPI0005535AE2|nr:ABC transporter ATP-binding protein SaoA [Maridesulfovibrio frigidus]
MHLHINNVSKTFSRSGISNTVLNDINFNVSSSQFLTLLGPSGCGKTTLLTIIAGFQKVTSGKIILNGMNVSKPCSDLGFMFQNYALFPWMSVRDNILFPLKQQKISKREQESRLAELLSLSRLEGKENLYPSQISGGMKQRTAFVRALAGNPEVLLMDEPLGAVDHQMRQALQEDLERLWIKDKTTVVMVTHDVDEAIYLSDRVIVMSSDQGRVVGDIQIKDPRPRSRSGPQYHKYKDILTSHLNQAYIPCKDEKESKGVEAA